MPNQIIKTGLSGVEHFTTKFACPETHFHYPYSFKID